MQNDRLIGTGRGNDGGTGAGEPNDPERYVTFAAICAAACTMLLIFLGRW
ncbi:MAG TPA: hypothetical protein VF911_19025 [Thermoanaerobaculia bacterium]|jgi:hypothetical protein